MKKIALAAAAMAALCACASTERFHWGNYENALYGYSKKPELRENYEKALRDAISRGEETARVAPGLYAELGYLALEAGDRRAAAEAFEKEMALFPESRVYLTKVMARGAVAPEGTETAPSEPAMPARDDQAAGV